MAGVTTTSPWRPSHSARSVPALGFSLKRLGGWLAGSQPPSFLLTGNDFPSLCSHFLRLPNWISDSPSGGGRMGVESPLGAPQGAFSHVPHSRVTWGQRD